MGEDFTSGNTQHAEKRAGHKKVSTTMSIADLFVSEFIGDKDTATHRVCGTCGELKPLEDFYKDGKDKNGNVRYRRDCKECYKSIRIIEAKMKERTKR